MVALSRKADERKRQLQLLSETEYLQDIHIHTFGPLSRPKNENPFFIVVTLRYLKLTGAITSSTTTTTHTEALVLNNCRVLHKIITFFLRNNEPWAVSDSFATLCGFLGGKNMRIRSTSLDYSASPKIQEGYFGALTALRRRIRG